MTEIHGPLEVDASRGEYLQFHVCGRQVLFPESMFEIRHATGNQMFDRSAPQVTVGRILSKAGRELFNRVKRLGGKGVTMTGTDSMVTVRRTQDLFVQEPCFTVTDVKANPEQDPILDPMLVSFIEAKEERDRVDAENKRRAEIAAAVQAEEDRQMVREEVERRLKEKKKTA